MYNALTDCNQQNPAKKCFHPDVHQCLLLLLISIQNDQDVQCNIIIAMYRLDENEDLLLYLGV